MKAVSRLFAFSALALMVAPAALAGGHTHVPNSTWKLNLGKSDFGKGPTMKSDLYAIHTDTEKWLSWDDTTVDGDGKTWKLSWSGPQDGSMHPVKGQAGASASAKTEDDSMHYRMPDGTVEDEFLTLSPDKKTATLKVDGRFKDGRTFHQTLVYDRVK